jgi:hypothetical protein
VISELGKLLTADAENTATTLEFIRGFDAGLPQAMDTAASLFDTFSHAFGQTAVDDAEQDELRECRMLLGIDSERLGELVSQGNTDPAATRARAAYSRIYSRRARGLLLLHAHRAYMFSATNLLRLRVSPAYGALRVECEAVALACVIQEDPAIGRQWFDVGLGREGHQFHSANQSAIKEALKRHGLVNAYELGSGVSLHPRFGSVVLGLSQRTGQVGDRHVEELRVEWQELKQNPSALLLAVFHVLRTQNRVFGALLEALPESRDPILAEARLPSFHRDLDRLWQLYTERFPEVVARAAARAKTLRWDNS